MATTALSIIDPAVGVVALGCAVAAYRGGNRRVAGLLAATGLCWFPGAIFPALVFVHRGPLIQLILTFPTGRRRGAFTTVAVATGYVGAVLAGISTNPWIPATSAALTAAAAIGRYVRATGHLRKSALPSLLAGTAFAVVVALGCADQVLAWGADLPIAIGYDLTVLAVLVGLTLAERFGRWTDAAVADLVTKVDESDPAGVNRELRRALGDPGLIVGYWSESELAFVDEAGRAVDIEPRQGRVGTRIDADGRPVAVLMHDASLAGDSTLIAGAGAVLRIAAANARMRAEVEERAARLSTARQRMVVAAEEQRMALEARVVSGPERQLAAMAAILTTLDDAPGGGTVLVAVRAELAAARRELRQFVNGIRPAELRDGGLALAVPALAGRAGLPVDVQVSVDHIDADAENAVYFLCSEALTNIAKHSGATVAAVRVTAGADDVSVRVTDNGRGGADPAGSGIRGMADRVEALGGTFAVGDGAERGTEIVARIPVEVVT